MSWRPNPYDEPPEVFDEWVAGLEAKILLALHPPRQKLFPDPEPVYVLPRSSSSDLPAAAPPTASPSPVPPAAAADGSTSPSCSDEEAVTGEIGYPLVPALTSVDKGKRRDDGRDMGHPDAPEPVVLSDEDTDAEGSSESDEEDGLSLQKEQVELSSSSEEEEEEEEQEEEEEESSDEEADYDSDGDVIPRPVKSLLDLEAVQDADSDASADHDDEADDDMFEDDADVLPPLAERSSSSPSAALAPPPDEMYNAAEPGGFVSALSLPLRHPSPVPAPAATAPSPPVVTAPPLAPSPAPVTAPAPHSSLPSPPPPPKVAQEVEVFELSDSDEGDEQMAESSQAAPMAVPSASSDAEESMERSEEDEDEDEEDESDEENDDSDVDLQNASEAYPRTEVGDEEDELEESESGEELDEHEGEAEFPPSSSHVPQPAFPEPAFDQLPPFQAYAQATQDSLDYSTQPDLYSGLAEDEIDVLYQSVDQPAVQSSPFAASQATFEVDPSLVEPDFPPAPLDMSALPAQAVADLVAITGGEPFAVAAEVQSLQQPKADEPRLSPSSPPPADEALIPADALPVGAEPLATSPALQSQPHASLDAAALVVDSSGPSPTGFSDHSAVNSPAAVASDTEIEFQEAVLHTGFTPELSSAELPETATTADDEDKDMLANDEAAATPRQAASPPTSLSTEIAQPLSDVPPAIAAEDVDEMQEVEPTPLPASPAAPPAPAVATAAAEDEDELEGSDGSSGIEIIEPPSGDQSFSSEEPSSESDIDTSEDEAPGAAQEEVAEQPAQPFAPARPAGSRLPLPLQLKNTSQVAATHAQANPFDALSIEGMSSEDEGAGSAQSDTDGEREVDGESTPVPQTRELPDAFEIEHEAAVQPDHPAAVVEEHSPVPTREPPPPTPPAETVAEPSPVDTTPNITISEEPAVAAAPAMPSEDMADVDEPLLPASPLPTASPLLLTPPADERSLPLLTSSNGFSSPLMPSTPPEAAMDIDNAPVSEDAASGIGTPAADEFEQEHEAAMQPLPAAVLDAEVEAAEDHTEDLTVAAQHSLDEFEREHDAAMQPPAKVVVSDIEHDEAAPDNNGSGSDASTGQPTDDGPILPLATPLHEPGELSLPGYVEPAAEPDLPDARAEPAPTTLITPPVPHASELEGSAVADPGDTRPTTPEVVDQPSEPLPPHEPLPDPLLPPPATDRPQPHVEPNLEPSPSLRSEDGESRLAFSVRAGKAPSEMAEAETDVISTAAAPVEETAASVAEPLGPTSSGISASTVVVETKSGEDDGDETDGGSDQAEDDEDESDDDGMVFIESRRMSESSSQKEVRPSPPRDLPERFLASDVFTEAPEELPTPPAAEPAPDRPSPSSSRAGTRTLSYHHHGSSSSSGGPARVPRAVVSAPFAGTPSPRKRSTTSPVQYSRATSPTVHSPVTRSQCAYHVLEVPGPGPQHRTRFAVPYCSLANVEAIKNEDAEVHGVASPDDTERQQPLVGNDAIELDEALDQALTRIVGIDMVKEGHCFFLERVAARPVSQTSMDSVTAGSVDAAEESASNDMDSESAASPRKRKRSEADDAGESLAEPASDASMEARPVGDDSHPAPQVEASADANESTTTKRQRLSEEPSAASATTPPPSRKWSLWPFSR